MIGPTVTIISKTACTEDIIALIHDIIDRTATSRDDDAFQVQASAGNGSAKSHTFDYEILDIEDSEYYPPEDLDRYESPLNGFPDMEVNLYAMGVLPEDHRILGQLALEIAEALDGLVDFHGELPDERIAGLAGFLMPLELETVSGDMVINHLADAEFMRNYLQRPDFKMVD